MSWGFKSPWAKYQFEKGRARPIYARSETIEEKQLFSGSWKQIRCLRIKRFNPHHDGMVNIRMDKRGDQKTHRSNEFILIQLLKLSLLLKFIKFI